MKRRNVITALAVVLVLFTSGLSAQTLAAPIQAFWNVLRTGGYAFTTADVIAGGYVNFGSTVGTTGYGIRDSAGTIQFKDSGGAWASLVAAVTGGTCTNQAVTAIAASTAVPTCTTLTSAYVDSSIAQVAAANLFTATQTITKLALGTTSTDGFLLQNTTPATGGTTVQISPRLKLLGTAYNSTGMASETDYFVMENLPATVAGTTTATWKLGVSIAGGAVTYPMTVSSAGNVVLLNSLFVPTGSGFIVNSRDQVTSPADGQTNIANNGNTAGIGFDVSTDSTLKIRTRAQSGYGTADALAYNASGTPITSGTTHLSAGSGMAVANVGANSCGTTSATIAGNNNAFVITVGGTGGTQCRVTFTVAAATEYDCVMTGASATLVSPKVATVDTTHTDFFGTFGAGSTFVGHCWPR